MGDKGKTLLRRMQRDTSKGPVQEGTGQKGHGRKGESLQGEEALNGLRRTTYPG